MADQKEPSKHGRKNSLTKLAHRIRHPHSSSSQPQQDTGVHITDEVLLSDESRTGTEYLGHEVDVHSEEHSLLIRAALERRQQQRQTASAPLQPLANDECARLFPLKCKKETWRRLLADFPEEKAALVALGRKS
ncbi:hypothetical protein E4U32_004461 [Claviceps aff. humidiphila group G2b]|nr:hypothetical protein E4U32_004461 [Claviceps aff. humidiphila group G2b]